MPYFSSIYLSNFPTKSCVFQSSTTIISDGWSLLDIVKMYRACSLLLFATQHLRGFLPVIFSFMLTGPVMVGLIVLKFAASCGEHRFKYSTHKNSNIMSWQ